jgi:hypothetical protein
VLGDQSTILNSLPRRERRDGIGGHRLKNRLAEAEDASWDAPAANHAPTTNIEDSSDSALRADPFFDRPVPMRVQGADGDEECHDARQGRRPHGTHSRRFSKQDAETIS